MANEILKECNEKYGYKKTLNEILEPVLIKMGEIWHKGIYKDFRISLAHGYMAQKITEDFLLGVPEEVLQNNKETKGTVVIGNIEEDYHSLGRKMIITFLKIESWNVIDMGNDVLANEFVDKAIENNAEIIGASSMMYSTAMNIKKLRKEIDNRGYKNKIMLAVGGAIFKLRPELVFEVGADGTAENAVDVPKLMEELLLKRR